MRILVAYASRHGATQGIAERIARTLERDGLEVRLQPVDRVDDVDGYDAFVIGSAAYYFHWLKEAAQFVRRNRALLASRPVWLFSSGPVGNEALGAEAEDPLEGSKPKEFDDFAAEIAPRDQRVFFGAYDPAAEPGSLIERLTRMMPAVRDSLSSGDFRDWPEIERWAHGIARALQAAPAAAQG